MATTFTLISAVTVGAGGAASIDFTSIPSTYTDLVLKISGRVAGTGSGTQLRVRFNGSATGYADRNVEGTGAATGSVNRTGSTYTYVTSLIQAGGGNPSPNTWSSIDMYVPNYAGAANKSMSFDSVTEISASTTAYADLTSGLWSNTSAITSINLTSQDGSNFVLDEVTTILRC